jgi:hypothetical protein
MSVNTDSHKMLCRERFFTTNQLARESTKTKTTTSKYSSARARGSGVIVDGCSYPVANSGFGKRCFWENKAKGKKQKAKVRRIKPFFIAGQLAKQDF